MLNREREHFRSMAICLYQFLKKITQLFGEFMEFNENRKRKLQGMITVSTKPEFKRPLKDEISLKRQVTSVDDELEQESQQIFKEKVSEQKKIEDTRKTL